MVYLISEIGSNWMGNLELAKNLIRLSKEAGVNAVKFQFWSQEQLYPGRPEMKKFELDWRSAQTLMHYAREIGIPWFCSLWNANDVSFFEDLHVKMYKLSTNRGIDLPLFQRVAETGKLVIVSVVPAFWALREDLIKDFGFEKEKIKLLYVVPKYPCGMDDVNWERVKAPHISGYSNHIPNPVACIVAYKKGAKVIETHVKLDEETVSPDASCSITISELKDLMEFFRREEGKDKEGKDKEEYEKETDYGKPEELYGFYKCVGHIMKNGRMAEEEFKEICKRKDLPWREQAQRLIHVTS